MHPEDVQTSSMAHIYQLGSKCGIQAAAYSLRTAFI
jgi:hypothetical protein